MTMQPLVAHARIVSVAGDATPCAQRLSELLTPPPSSVGLLQPQQQQQQDVAAEPEDVIEDSQEGEGGALGLLLGRPHHPLRQSLGSVSAAAAAGGGGGGAAAAAAAARTAAEPNDPRTPLLLMAVAATPPPAMPAAPCTTNLCSHKDQLFPNSTTAVPYNHTTAPTNREG